MKVIENLPKVYEQVSDYRGIKFNYQYKIHHQYIQEIAYYDHERTTHYKDEIEGEHIAIENRYGYITK